MRTRRVWFWVLVAGAGLLAGAAGRIAYSLGVIFSLWQPIRPHSVSTAAVYVSTVEDGYWFDCRVDKGQNVDVCRAWDYLGKLVADDRFQLECEGRAATLEELRPTVVERSNGRTEAIYLLGRAGNYSTKLVPVGRTRAGRCVEGR